MHHFGNGIKIGSRWCKSFLGKMRNCEIIIDHKSIYSCKTSNGRWRVCMRARDILKVFLESSHACLKFPGWAQ